MKKDSLNIYLPKPVDCPHCVEKSHGMGKMLPLFIRENNMSKDFNIIRKCNYCGTVVG